MGEQYMYPTFPPPPARHPGYAYGSKIRTSRGVKFLFDQHQLFFFKKSTQRRLVKSCKDAAGSEDNLVTV